MEELTDLIAAYEVHSKKYKLPGFKELNEDFEIEKIDRESQTLLRVIRKAMIEKVVNSLGFLEMLLNPMNAPRMYFQFIKSMTTEDKKIIEELYNHLSDLSVGSLSLEIDYSEKDEAQLIAQIYKVWGESKPLFRQLLKKVRKPEQASSKKERSYFG